MPHFKAKIHQIRFLVSVRLSTDVRWSTTLWVCACVCVCARVCQWVRTWRSVRSSRCHAMKHSGQWGKQHCLHRQRRDVAVIKCQCFEQDVIQTAETTVARHCRIHVATQDSNDDAVNVHRTLFQRHSHSFKAARTTKLNWNKAVSKLFWKSL